MLPLILVIVVFVTVVLVVFAFGAAVVTPSSVLGARLRALGGGQQPQAENKAPLKERIEQAMDPSAGPSRSPRRMFRAPAPG